MCTNPRSMLSINRFAIECSSPHESGIIYIDYYCSWTVFILADNDNLSLSHHPVETDSEGKFLLNFMYSDKQKAESTALHLLINII